MTAWGSGYGVDLCSGIDRLHLGLSDIIREFDDFQYLTRAVLDRVVVAANKDFGAILSEPGEFAAHEFSAFEFIPELGVICGPCIILVEKQSVVLSAKFCLGVSHQVAEILVGLENISFYVKLDDRKGEIQRIHDFGSIRIEEE